MSSDRDKKKRIKRKNKKRTTAHLALVPRRRAHGESAVSDGARREMVEDDVIRDREN